MKNNLTLFFLFVLLITSCKKEQIKERSQQGGLSTNLNKSKKLTNSPKNINGILTFDSEQHLQSYYLSLEEIIESGHDNNLDVDSLLKEVEDGVNFLSFRQDLINKYDWEGKEFTAEEIDELYKIDFIIDEARKSILNEHMEFAIGKYIYVYYSDNRVYKIPDSNIQIIEEFRKLEKGNDDVVPHSALNNGVELLSTKSKLDISIKEFGDLSQKNGYSREFSYTTDVTNLNCEIYKKAYYADLKSRYYDTIDSAWTQWKPYAVEEIKVELGDNSVRTFYNDNAIWAYHNYTQTGVYMLTFTYKHRDDDNNLVTKHKNETVIVEGACTSDNASLSDNQTYNQINGDTWRMNYKTWVREDMFGRHLGAHTHSWKWHNRKSKWKRAKTSLFCRVEGDFRDDQCIVKESLSKSKTKYGKRLSSKKHRIKKKWEISNGDIRSSHQIHGSSTYYESQELNPCD